MSPSPPTPLRVINNLSQVSAFCDDLIINLRPKPGDPPQDDVPPLPMDTMMGAALKQAARLIGLHGSIEPHLTFVGISSTPVVLLRGMLTLDGVRRAELATEFQRVVSSGHVYGRVFMATMVPSPYNSAEDAIKLATEPGRPYDQRLIVVIVASTQTSHVIEFWEVEQEAADKECFLRLIDADDLVLVPALEPLLLNPFELRNPAQDSRMPAHSAHVLH